MTLRKFQMTHLDHQLIPNKPIYYGRRPIEVANQITREVCNLQKPNRTFVIVEVSNPMKQRMYEGNSNSVHPVKQGEPIFFFG